jgi:hypothetical protein
MDEIWKREIVQKTLELWDAGNALEAGQIIFEHLPRESRPPWAATVLKIAYEQFPPAAAIEAVIEFAEHPDRWGTGAEGRYHEAHQIVDEVNRFPYLLPEPFSQTIYTLAKNVGKVVYNAQLYPAPFDHEAGWEIAETLKHIVRGINSDEFAERAWMALCNEKYI